MSEQESIYAGFLGTWTLLPGASVYEQGQPPKEGSYRIDDEGGTLTFVMEWVDADDERHRLSFSGVPDGVPVPFAGGDLADALSVDAPGPKELNSRAYFQGEELMRAQRQLDATGQAMRVTQIVRFPDGTLVSNQSVYRKAGSA